MTPDTLHKASVLANEIYWLKRAISEFADLKPPMPDRYQKPESLKVSIDLPAWANYVVATREMWQRLLKERELELERL